MFRLTALLMSGAVAVATWGCSGDSYQRPPSCDGPIEPGPSPIRRLTRVEYNNTVFQLLGDLSNPADAFPPDEEAQGFDNQATALVVSPLLAEQYAAAAETLAINNAPLLLQGLPACAGAAPDQAACAANAAAFIESFGKRAYRRPLEAAEIASYKALFDQGVTLGDTPHSPLTGLELVVQAFLQSPHFLYRVEFGLPDPVEGDVVPLSPYEMASRLSYMFWNTMPDAALFEAADRDELRTREQLAAQARRMLEAPRAREAVKNFHRQWLGLDEIVPAISANGKDTDIYPKYVEPILPLLQRETEEFLDHAIFVESASVDQLFTASYSMMNGRLAEFYGVSGPAGDAFVRVNLDPTRYAGFLTQAGLLALYAKPDRSSPVHRGQFVRERLLCRAPPPPPDVIPEPPTVDDTQTTRDQFEQHVSDQLCFGCHRLMDPIGFGLENFDGLGLYRDTQSGKPIDARGELVETIDIDGPFDGAVELAQRLGGSEQVRDCVATQWFRFSYGRSETAADTCSVDEVKALFADANYDVKELMVALTQTDAFRYRHAVNPSEVSQ